MADARNQVVSARLPEALASRLVAVAAERGLRPSDVVREALEAYFFGARTWDVVVVQPGLRVRVIRHEPGYETENPVVTEHPALVFGPTTVALGG